MDDAMKRRLRRYGPWAAVALVLLLLGAGFASAFNDLVAREEGVEAQARQVDVAYQRAFRLVPQLLDLAEGFLENETEVMQSTTRLRSGLVEAEGGGLRAKDAYMKEMMDFVALVGNRAEAYPELRASELYRDTMTEVTNTENKIAAEKVRYNDRVQGYNAALRTCCMPRLVASLFSFDPAVYIGFEGRPETVAWDG